MAHVSPFAALRPTPDRAAQVASVPYDVVDTAEAAALAAGNPYSFLRVSRPEIELPPGTDLHSDVVYDRAVSNFARLRAAAPLVTEDAPSYYIYRLSVNGRTQTGITAAASVDDYDADRILKHEKTRKDKEDDRTRHVLQTRCHSGPVFLLHRADATLAALVAQTIADGPPLFDVAAPDGVRHEVWRLPAARTAAMQAAFAAIPQLYIADGHHRAKAASRARAELRAANPAHTGAEAYNRFLAVIFPHDQLTILPYNRVLRDLNGLTPAAFLARLAQDFAVTPASQPSPAQGGIFHLYLEQQWYALRPLHAPTSALPDERLDVSVLQQQVLAPILGIDDPRTSKRVDFVGGIRGTPELIRLVDSGACAAAIAMFPTTVGELMAIADAGRIMPPKSTWFEPKLRDGLLLHCF